MKKEYRLLVRSNEQIVQLFSKRVQPTYIVLPSTQCNKELGQMSTILPHPSSPLALDWN